MSETRAVAKAILAHDGKILVLRRSETDRLRPLQWDVPGGAIDPGEDVKAACAREVLEETGLAIRAEDCKTVYAMTEVVAENISATFIFFKIDIEPAETILSYEHIEAAWMTLEEALKQFTYERHLRVFQYMQQHDLLTATTSD